MFNQYNWRNLMRLAYEILHLYLMLWCLGYSIWTLRHQFGTKIDLQSDVTSYCYIVRLIVQLD